MGIRWISDARTRHSCSGDNRDQHDQICPSSYGSRYPVFARSSSTPMNDERDPDKASYLSLKLVHLLPQLHRDRLVTLQAERGIPLPTSLI